jgi:hypothetical protein
MKIQRGKLDIVMSNLVRCATNYTCENCGKYYPPELRKGIHCSHYWGRAIKQLRYSELNTSALCYGCHMRFTSDPWAHTDFMRKKVGQETLEKMAVLAYSKYKFTQKEQDLALAHLIEQWRIMSIERRAGNNDKLKYEGWTPWFTR